MIVWIRDNRYYVQLHEGASFGIDRHGAPFRWHRPSRDAHVGRLVLVRGRDTRGFGEWAHLPEHIVAIIDQAEKTGQSPIPAVAV